MSAYTDDIRKRFKESDDIRDAGLVTPAEIMRYDNIVYGRDNKWQVLDVYRRKDMKGKKLPVIISIHGGGWVYGDKERYQFYCMELAMKGFAVINFTYRLAPEFKFPASLEDTNLVVSWLMEHAKEYDFDTKHVFAVGDSAGAHILALYSCICTNKEYAKQYAFQVEEQFHFTAIALNCGVYKTDKESKLMEELLPGRGTKDELEKLDALRYVTKEFPPVFLMTSTGDFLKMQAVDMACKLTEHNVPFEYHFYGDAKKLLGHVFHCDMNNEDGKRCNEDECDFFKSYLSVE